VFPNDERAWLIGGTGDPEVARTSGRLTWYYPRARDDGSIMFTGVTVNRDISYRADTFREIAMCEHR
jgi:hypothetical protein